MRLLLAILVLLALPAAAQGATFAAVGGLRDPASGVLDLSVQAVENEGVGLRQASATLDGQGLATASFDDPTSSVGTAALAVDTSAVPDGVRRLVITVEDAAGTVTTVLDHTITVANTLPTWTSTVVVSVGAGATSPKPSPGPGPGPQPGPRSGCASPRLSVFLAQRPLRLRRGRPLLRAGRRYRFEGKLTCRLDGRRRPAPRSTLVGIRNRLHGRLVVRKPAKVRGGGRFVVKLAHRRSCVVLFRVRAASGRLVSVRIPIRVARR
jgi:hypothetical protein